MTDPRREGYLISTDPARLQIDVIYDFLTTSYWAAGIQPDAIRRSIDHSLPFGVFEEATGRQVGFARVITDRTTFAYLADVFVLDSHRRRGLALWLMEVILGHPELQGLRRWMLATRDAHRLYGRVGFTPLANPSRLMERPIAASPLGGSP